MGANKMCKTARGLLLLPWQVGQTPKDQLEVVSEFQGFDPQMTKAPTSFQCCTGTLCGIYLYHKSCIITTNPYVISCNSFCSFSSSSDFVYGCQGNQGMAGILEGV